MSYFKSHVGGVDHAECGHAEVREHPCAEHDQSQEEEPNQYIGGTDVDALGEAVERSEGAKALVDVIEGRGGEGLDAVQHSQQNPI
jgi:hypothetical protein